MVFEKVMNTWKNKFRLSSRSFGRSLHNYVKHAKEDEAAFRERMEKLKKAIEDGNLKAVEDEFGAIVVALQNLSKDVFFGEETAIYYAHKQDETFKKEMEQLKEEGKKAIMLTVNKMEHYHILGIDKHQFIQNKEFKDFTADMKKKYDFEMGPDMHHFTENLKKKFEPIAKRLNSIHLRYKEILNNFQKLSRDERWNAHRFRDLNLSLNMIYGAEQSASAIRYKNRVLEKAEKAEEKQMHEAVVAAHDIHKKEDVEKVIKELYELEKEVEKEEVIAKKIGEYLMTVFKFFVTFFFYTMNDDDKIKEIAGQLKAEKFPPENMEHLAKEIERLNSEINKLSEEEGHIAVARSQES
jgi:hypothetical protein